MGSPYSWPKINGFHWGYFIPRSGGIGPYVKLVGAHLVKVVWQFFSMSIFYHCGFRCDLHLIPRATPGTENELPHNFKVVVSIQPHRKILVKLFTPGESVCRDRSHMLLLRHGQTCQTNYSNKVAPMHCWVFATATGPTHCGGGQELPEVFAHFLRLLLQTPARKTPPPFNTTSSKDHTFTESICPAFFVHTTLSVSLTMQEITLERSR